MIETKEYTERDKENKKCEEKKAKENKKCDEEKPKENDGHKQKFASENFLSPPKKRFKQDSTIEFPKLSKEEAIKETEKLVVKEAEKQLHKSPKSAISSKQDSIEFPKLSKEEAIKEAEKLVVKEAEKQVQKIQKPAISSKQDAIPFPKITKEEALKKVIDDEKAVLQTNTQQKADTSITDIITSPARCPIVNTSTTPISTTNDVSVVTPESASGKKKMSPISKEERQKAKELKEQQKLARLKELEEKKKKKEDEKLLRQIEKEKRDNERKEKERQKEEEKKKREEEKRKKDEEKEIERRQKEAEREKKEVERKQKELLKQQEDEKKRLEEELARKKKEKAANQFKSFFTKKKSVVVEKKVEQEVYHRFQPFQLKPCMTLAPVCRSTISNKQLLDKAIVEDVADLPTYLEEISVKLANNKRKKYVTRRQLRREYEEKRKLELRKNSAIKQSNIEEKKVEPLEILIIDDSNDDDDDDDTETSFNETKLVKTKLLQFSENTRPPYYGTWNKTTKQISGRKPYGLDKEIFNYDVDSDEDWIDEPGEDCSDVDEDDCDEDKETEEDQDGFFVPHGYLSDDEGVKDSDSEEEEGDDEEMVNGKVPLRNEREAREEEKLRAKACSFEVGFKRKLKARKPMCIGITFNMSDLPAIFKEYGKVSLFKEILEKTNLCIEDCEDEMETESPNRDLTQNKIEPGVQVAQTVPEEAMPFLLRMLHGSTTGMGKMLCIFKEFWGAYVKEYKLETRSAISNRQLERKIQAISKRNHKNELGKICYTVNSEILEHYKMTDLKLGDGLPSLKKTDVDDTISQIKNNVPVGTDCGVMVTKQISVSENTTPMEVNS